MPAAPEKDPFFGPHPPKPILTLRVGIVGHRPKPERYADGIEDFVKERIGEVFHKIDASVTSIAAEQARLAANNENDYAVAPACVRLVSGLAEGADQWAVEKIPAGWTVDAVLPFPTPSYRKDFQRSATSKDKDIDVTAVFDESIDALRKSLSNIVQLPEETPPPKDAKPDSDEYRRYRDPGYARSGRFLLGQIDLLVAVWDGKPKEGPGGTAAMVQVALDGDIPVFWIHSREKIFVRRISRIGDNGLAEAPAADCLISVLDEAIDRIVLPSANDGADFAKRLHAFLKEARPRPLYGYWLIYDAFKRWHEDKWPQFRIKPRTKAQYEAEWNQFIAKAPRMQPFRERLEAVVLPRYAWADALAVEAAHRYRSTYFLIYILAASAVFVALSAIFFHDAEGDGRKLAIKAALVTLELVILVAIFLFVWAGRRRRLHERWVEYRSLAELLLNARFLAYFGEHGRAPRTVKLEPEPSAWFLWYLRATIREIGLPDAGFDGAYQGQLLEAVKEQVIGKQSGWHRANGSALGAMHRSLSRGGLFCLFATFIFLIVFLLAWLVFVFAIWKTQDAALLDLVGLGRGGPEMEKMGLCSCAPFWHIYGGALLRVRLLVVFVAAFLPALGAAFTSIRETGDFEKIAKQSGVTAADLDELHDAFETGQERLKFDHTDDLLRQTARVLSDDLSAWQSVYGYKRLELPS